MNKKSEMKINNSFIKIGIILYFIFAFFLIKSNYFSNYTVIFKSPTIEKATSEKLTKQFKQQANQQKINAKKANVQQDDTLHLSKKPFAFPQKMGNPSDTLKRILLIGDSQLENLRYWVRKSLLDNNYKLSASIIWYGSSTKQWALTDTLEYYFHQYQPDFVLIALGLNELFVNDLSNRELYSKQLKYKLSQLHVPYYFIGPAAWVKDRGITQVIQSVFGETFYPSHLLKLDRAADGRHPSKAGAKIWFTSVAQKMTELRFLDLHQVKDTTYKGSSPTILLKVPSE